MNNVISISTKESRKEQFLKENYLKWNEEGMKYRERRLEKGYSLADIGKLLGTSASRIGRFEKGEPISQAKHLKKTYSLLLDHLELHEVLYGLGKNPPWMELYSND